MSDKGETTGDPAGTNVSSSSVLAYNCKHTTNSVSWSNRKNQPFRVAVGSFNLAYENYIDILQKVENRFVSRVCFRHAYPPTRVMFAPPPAVRGGAIEQEPADLIATSADFLRLWEVKQKSQCSDTEFSSLTGSKHPADEVASVASGRAVDDDGTCRVKLKIALTPTKSDFCAPLTSLDWNWDDCDMVATSSVDTTVSIWNIERNEVTTQLIAHDKDVFDVAFAKGKSVFATCGADGSLRMFDLREMEHCTITYEAPELKPLLRLAWNKLEPSLIATFTSEGKDVIILDVRFPGLPVGILSAQHTDCVNAVAWAPASSTHLCTVGEDKRALIWDITDLPNATPTAMFTYDSPYAINSMSWSNQEESYIAISCDTWLQVLLV